MAKLAIKESAYSFIRKTYADDEDEDEAPADDRDVSDEYKKKVATFRKTHYVELNASITPLSSTNERTSSWTDSNRRRRDTYQLDWIFDLTPISDYRPTYVRIRCSPIPIMPSDKDILCSEHRTPVTDQKAHFHYSTNLPDISKRPLYAKVSVVRDYKGEELEEEAFLFNVSTGEGIPRRE